MIISVQCAKLKVQLQLFDYFLMKLKNYTIVELTLRKNSVMFSISHFVRKKSVKCLRAIALENIKTFVKNQALLGSRFGFGTMI